MLQVMRSSRLDLETADRMLDGSVRPMDAPPGYEHVAGLLLELRDVAADRCPSALLVGANGASPDHRRRGMLVAAQLGVRRSLLVGAFAFAALTGTAYAAGLPGAASSTASAVLEKLGVPVSGPDSHAGTHPGGQATTATVPSDPGTPTAASEETAPALRSGHIHRVASKGKGSAISTIARTTTATGVEKGAAVSTAASGGASQAGRHGQAGQQEGKPSGTGSGGGPNAHGLSTAHEASGGHSSARSGNAH
jgi:hypothetical protein